MKLKCQIIPVLLVWWHYRLDCQGTLAHPLCTLEHNAMLAMPQFLSHIALHKVEQLRDVVKEVGDDGVHWNEVERQLRIQVWVVMGLDTFMTMGGEKRGKIK